MPRLVTSLEQGRIGDYLARQLNTIFPDGREISAESFSPVLTEVLERLEKIQSHIRNGYAWRDGSPFFNHLNSDHYATFLYLISYCLGREEQHRENATKVFLLNKALNALDVYFEVKLPEIFLLAHPVGTILGRANYADYFLVMQNCTVGNIDGKYPEMGQKVLLKSQSSVLGASVLGEGVCVGAGSLLLNATIPPYRTVVGRAKDIIIGREHSEKWRDYFRE